nr:rRNA methyltransferase 3, mitochondrial-like [Halyomorpha halys]
MLSYFKLRYIFRSLCSPAQSKWFDLCRNVNQSALESNVKNENHLKNISGSEQNLNKKITKLNFNDQTLSQLMLQVKSRKMRKKSNLIYFEGKRILKEALENGIDPLAVFFSKADDIKSFKFSQDTKLYKMPYNEMKMWSDLTTAPGIIAVCNKPSMSKFNKPDVPVSILCDNIREPGNLGALIRTTVGAGAKDVILSKGCVDAWDPKVIRGSSGILFRIPIVDNIDWSDMKSHLHKDALLLVATNKFSSKESETKSNPCVVPYYEVDYCNYPSICIIIGGETEGVSESSLELMTSYNHKMINIPLSNEVESLNSVSALSIILFEIRRQIMFNKLL